VETLEIASVPVVFGLVVCALLVRLPDVTRFQYACYLGLRIAEALSIACGGAILADCLQAIGFLRSPLGIAPRLLNHAPILLSELIRVADRWTWPALAACITHLLLGPKQEKPVYLRIPGAMFVYAGIRVDRNAGCRGGCTTGATGSGKTQACIVPRLHSLCINDCADGPGGRGNPPWGGLICGEKGNEWQTIVPLLRRHRRDSDVRLLQTRPEDARGDWAPPERFNLISLETIPADTYAKIIVDTARAVEESERTDEFFVPQARDKIAWGIRLMRAGAAIGQAQSGTSPASLPAPDLVTLLDILTVPESYRRFLMRLSAAEPSGAPAAPVQEARYQLENNYWNQPAEQLGGVRGTIYNFLVPFTEPEIAQVFCADNTFDLRDIEKGAIVCLALPQKFALQRRYVTTLLKVLAYQIIRNRFDRCRARPDWTRRNLILIEQDEWQRHAIRTDGDVDVIREAGGTTYAATQTQNAVWARLGGREQATPILANLRNRWICQAASDDCADESAKTLGERLARIVSFSRGENGRTENVSYAERPFVSKAQLRALPPFHVYFAPAEGPWLYKKCIAMPATPEGGIPPWWFGDWNIVRWAAFYFRLPESLLGRRLYRRDEFIPPWRGQAPLRAQVRRLLGLDGTFIILETMSVRRAQRLASRGQRM